MKIFPFLLMYWLAFSFSTELPGFLYEKSPVKLPPKTSIIKKNYDLLIGKNEIGTFKISKTVNGNTIRYQAISDANFRVISKNHVVYQLDCTVENGLLITSHCTVHKNGKLKDNTTIKWENDHYTINKKGKITTYNKRIPKPAIALYFEEPTQEAVNVFSEREAVFKSFTRKETNKYKLCPLGKRSGDEYTYQNGELQEVVVNYVVANFRTVLR